MRRSVFNSPATFGVVVFLTLVMALLPTRLVHWTGDVAMIVRLPVQPLGHVMEDVATWLRSPPAPAGTLPREAQGIVDELARERDAAIALYQQSQLRVEELERRLSELERANQFSGGGVMTPRLAEVVSRNPNVSLGVVEINKGARDGVRPGTVVVHGGVHIVGRVTDVSRVNSRVVAVSSKSVGFVRGIVTPASQPLAALANLPRVQLEPAAGGMFEAEAARDSGISVGDVVRLADDRWPAPVQGMELGVVRQITPKDQSPLRDMLVIEPRYQLRDLSSVTLLVPSEGVREGGREGGSS